MLISMVLLDANSRLDPAAVQKAGRTFEGLSGLEVSLGTGASPRSFDLKVGSRQYVAMAMGAPVPGGEADVNARLSLSRHGQGAPIRPHTDHLIVTALSGPSPTIDERVEFTRIVAALAAGCDSAGVYWGGGPVTHPTDFFCDVAALERPTMAWVGISLALRADGNGELLSVGMKQFGLDDLLLITSAKGSDDIELFFDLLTYVIDFGKPLPEGNTIGRTANEKLKVGYAPHPTEKGKRVWTIDVSRPKGFLARLFGG